MKTFPLATIGDVNLIPNPGWSAELAELSYSFTETFAAS
jgi:hypothetical protein